MITRKLFFLRQIWRFVGTFQLREDLVRFRVIFITVAFYVDVLSLIFKTITEMPNAKITLRKDTRQQSGDDDGKRKLKAISRLQVVGSLYKPLFLIHSPVNYSCCAILMHSFEASWSSCPNRSLKD